MLYQGLCTVKMHFQRVPEDSSWEMASAASDCSCGSRAAMQGTSACRMSARASPEICTSDQPRQAGPRGGAMRCHTGHQHLQGVCGSQCKTT